MSEIDQERADGKVRTNCLLVLTVIAVGVALYLLRPVLVPFVLALLFAYCLAPLIDFGVRFLRLPREAAVIAAILLGLVLLVLFALLVGSAVSQLADSFGAYERQFRQLIKQIKELISLESLGLKPNPETGLVFTGLQTASRQFIRGVIVEITALLSNGSLVMIFLIFILLGRKGGPQHSTGLLARIETRVKRYLVLMLFLSVLSGVLVGLALTVLGVDFAWVFGFLAFLLNFIPNIGSIIATLLPLPVVLLSPDLSVAERVLALAVPAGIQFALGSFVQPRLQGRALELHPVAVLLALVFFGMIWGLVGAFLAAPITAVVKIVFENIPNTRPLAELLEGNLDSLSGPVEAETAKLEPPAG
jgi:AI-2 transport protein TqsA